SDHYRIWNSSVRDHLQRICDVGHIAALSSFFFFQAEDGIRDRNVTGVQTCALPISATLRERAESGRINIKSTRFSTSSGTIQKRSEERRVGKEGRSRWSREP